LEPRFLGPTYEYATDFARMIVCAATKSKRPVMGAIAFIGFCIIGFYEVNEPKGDGGSLFLTPCDVIALNGFGVSAAFAPSNASRTAIARRFKIRPLVL